MKNIGLRIAAALCGVSLCSAAASAQQIDLRGLDKLAARATAKTEVTLDPATLKFASAFMGDGDKDESAAKKVIAGLKGIYVRSYEFERAGMYDPKDLQPLRDQIRGSQWSSIVSVREKDEQVDIWVYRTGDTTGGMVIVSAEPKEVTVVNIVGPIRPEDLSTLGGQFGIPKNGAKK